ncbi:MAG: cytochrome C oxidase subunit II [Alphaproteobacteria bacterium]|nr:cytochrome C oxidase subunit II [Alphaproteobacteria bacterium]MBF0391814.1 cytochrome C oxidase subunit II [Alphaproteobacteria bacterium]
MSISPPSQKIWWREPIEKAEIVWVALALVWCLIMFAMMPLWHLKGSQNMSNEAYRISPEAFQEKVEAMVSKYKVGTTGKADTPVVHPPPGSDVYLMARLWDWYPVLELEKDKSYRVHISSLDWQHGFSLQPANINLQVHPGIDMVVTLTPTTTGEFGIVCNEFCGIGHHSMLGKLRVVGK